MSAAEIAKGSDFMTKLLSYKAGGQRPNWGDAESSDEDIPPRGGAKGASKTTASGPSWDEDLSAFMGQECTLDDRVFEDQLKRVPQWVEEKARSQRKRLLAAHRAGR
eukprot:TRINITY_DN36596_c0_g1_i1.p2 TRINITY_DN36596_c0_g1~~TRINITY_DN36596_c0_g1_i1.p2  ORF type:complete len:107 (+),score=19.84 TRINITY_DN36596_c0_g1_i1:475-795(+)